MEPNTSVFMLELGSWKREMPITISKMCKILSVGKKETGKRLKMCADCQTLTLF